MIIIKLSGGLGNQMFQYALGLVLEQKLNIQVKYDLSFFQNRKNTHNNILIHEIFKIDIEVAKKKELYIFAGINASRVFRKISKIFNLNNSKYIFEDDKKNPMILNENLNNCYLDGYWQNWEYFKDYKKEINKIFRFKPVKSKKFNETKKQILNKKSAIIHFRRGDYKDKKNKKIFYQLGKAYYQEAIQVMRKKNKDLIIYVFSDEVDLAKDFFTFEKNLVFINLNKGKDSYRDMYLMSLSKNIIISNSTFSWWAAWLGKNKNIIIAPKLWFKQEKKAYHYYLPEWHII